MIRILPILFLLCLVSATVCAEEIQPISNQELIQLLANVEVLAKVEGPPLRVSVLRVQDHGECDGSPKTCPLSVIYLAVSEYDEYPKQNVYLLPKRHSWEFVSWNKAVNGFVGLELKAQIPSETPQQGWWVPKSYLVEINSEVARITEKAAL